MLVISLPGPVNPYLMSCSLPVSDKGQVPVMVSLVEDKCEEARNSLKVIYNPLREKEHKQKFAVCSKGLGKGEC